MALSLPQHNATLAGTNQLAKPMSYAHAVIGKRIKTTQQQQKSLIHDDIISSQHPDEPTSLTTVKTRIYRNSRTEGAFLFNVSGCYPVYTEDQIKTIVKEQHPNCYSVIPMKDGEKQYLEVYMDREDDSNDIVENGLVFNKIKTRVIPCRALSELSHIVTVKLSNLPIYKRGRVLAGLKNSLAIFGHIMDLGIYVDKQTDFFVGNGYVVLDVTQVEGEQPFHPLTHVINWKDAIKDVVDVFHATWNKMPTWCRYCHQEGHTKFSCALSKAKMSCYACHEHGHRSFECPNKKEKNVDRKKMTLKGKKTAKKSHNKEQTADKNSDTTSTHQPSKEILKSKYAPDNTAPSSSKKIVDTVLASDDEEDDLDYVPQEAAEGIQEEDADMYSVNSEVSNEELQQLREEQQLFDREHKNLPTCPEHDMEEASSKNINETLITEDTVETTNSQSSMVTNYLNLMQKKSERTQ